MSDTTTETTGTIVWFEIPALDTGRAQRFYARLFGWEYERHGEEDYHLSYAARGAIHAAREASGLLAFFGVDDIEAVVARVREAGGEAEETQEIPGTGLYAHCRDSEGNPFGLYQDLAG